MKTEEIVLNNLTLDYPIKNLADPYSVLFFDIETTGFISESSSIYLIGCAYYQNDNWCIKQFFASSDEEEETILEAFLNFANNFDLLIHFNGNSFDIPFLRNKAKKYNITFNLDQKNGIDIMKRIKPYRNMLKLPDCKLKTIEAFLGTDRQDTYSGGELIPIYKEYLNSHDYNMYHTLIRHNSDDIKGMLGVLPILSYYDLFNSPLLATGVRFNNYTDINGFARKEIVINIAFESKVPKMISVMGRGCHFKAEDNEGVLVIPVYEEELKFFYANYRDYYYLPLEDMALHKSIATYVDKEFRKQAAPDTCYTRKTSEYLPQWTVMIEPFFKREYESTDLYFEITDEIKQNRDLFSAYAQHVINAIAFQK